MQHFKPFIVIGTGRSGTTTTAKILHEKLKVFMGNRFRGGHYEDLDFKDNDDLFLSRKIDLCTWRICLADLIRKRQKEDRPWGFKNPRNAYLLDLYFEYFMSPNIIYCIRNKKQIVSSLMKNYGWPGEVAETVYNERTQIIEEVLEQTKLKHLILDFTEYLSEEYVINKIKNFFNLQ